MISGIIAAVVLVVGVLTGASFAALVVRQKMEREVERATLQKQSEMAVLQERATALEMSLSETRQALDTAAADALDSRSKVAALEAQLDGERKLHEEKLGLLNEAQAKFSDVFKALSAEALSNNNRSFLDLAKEALASYRTEAKGDLDLRRQSIEALVLPIKQSLDRVAQQVQTVDNDRKEAYGSLVQQVRSLVGTQELLRSETGKLVQALRTPNVRGRWGEIQLRKVVELSGMLAHCDFEEQVSTNSGEGRLKPDLVVHLPGGKSIIVDAKTPLQAYLEATEAQTDDERRSRLAAHAEQVRGHMAKLGGKEYWREFQPAPEFVVMFLPGEAFFSAALDQDPGLIETGVSMKVIPASPTTLIALLKGVAYGWQQEALAENAARISRLGRELYERLSTAAGHIQGIGRSLKKAVEEYNSAIGSLEARVLVSGRRLGTLASSPGDLAELEPVEAVPRALQAPDWKLETDPAAGATSGAPEPSEES
jgi:DNA recombination protein RmuC